MLDNFKTEYLLDLVEQGELQTWCRAHFAEHIWNASTRLSDNSKRIDIVFNLYIDSSIKGNEENVVRNLCSQLLQPFTIKTKNFLSQWKVFGLPLQTTNNYSRFL